MSSQSLKSRQGQKDTNPWIDRFKKGKRGKSVTRVKVHPNPPLDITMMEKVDPNSRIENEVPSLTDMRKVGTPLGMNAEESVLEVNKTKMKWSENKRGSITDSQNELLHRRSRYPKEPCIIRAMVALAFIFSLISFCLVLIMMKELKNNCACHEKNQGSGKYVSSS